MAHAQAKYMPPTKGRISAPVAAPFDSKCAETGHIFLGPVFERLIARDLI